MEMEYTGGAPTDEASSEIGAPTKTIKEHVSDILRNVPFIGKTGGSSDIYPLEIDEDEGKVYILETALPINPEGGKYVPSPKKFEHFALDARTLKVMESIATAVELGDPCLLEGETSTSKTSSIEYVAMLSNNPVIRFNLNGQTDTSEFIGRYVPNDGSSQLSFEEMLRDPTNLSGPSQKIVSEARKEGRSLTLEESQSIAEHEKVAVAEWKWQDGVIPTAMKNGYWVILDEINLGEPQILERINSVLERHPSLTLTEHNGERVGAGAEADVHPNFRIFATMNPADYSGRSVLSPAYKDRWINQVSVSNPTAEEYKEMMKLLVFGIQPDVKVRDTQYKGEKVEPFFERLDQVRGIENIIVRVAKFQEELEKLCRNKDIGRGRKEGYVFTRRGLIEFLEYLDKKTIIDRKTKKEETVLDEPKKIILRGLEYSFLEKFSNPDDLQKVMDLLAALKLTDETLTFGGHDNLEELNPEIEPDVRESIYVAGELVNILNDEILNGVRIDDRFRCGSSEYIVYGFTSDGRIVRKDVYYDELSMDDFEHVKSHL